MINKTFICLANSNKLSGRCIAGKEEKSFSWIRPVSNRRTEEISENERRLKTGKKAEVLDIIKIQFIKHQPNLFQTENYLINDKFCWEKIGEYPVFEIPKLCDHPETLWLNGYKKGYNCVNNCIMETDAQDLKSSLYLITPEELSIIVEMEWPGQDYSKLGVKAQFQYNNIEYIIAITDSKIKHQYISKGENSYFIESPQNRIFMCISLGLPWESSTSGLPSEKNCYKLVATVIGL